MRFNSVKGGDYSSGARAVNKNADAAFDASRKSSFNFTKTSNAAINARSTERRAAMKAENLKDTTQIKADTLVEGTQIKADSDKAVADAKRPAKRMAGVVAGLGTIATGYMMGQGKKEDAAAQAKRDAAFDARTAAYLKLGDRKTEPWKPTAYKSAPSPTFVKPNYSGIETDTSTTPAVPSTPKPPSTSVPTSTSSGSTSFTPSTSTGNMSSQFKQIYDLAVKDGRSRFPEIVAAQAMHETGHLNPDMPSVYNSSGGKNPFGQTGDRGYGTMTRKGDPSGWSNFPDLQTAVSDHITLWHDTGNHSDNYNAHSTVAEGLSKVIPAYSPNSDPANQSAGFTESAYSASVKKILRDNGFNI